jgi:hypothetical protein
MEERPSTITSLGEVIASHKVLRRKNWLFLTIPELESRFNNLSE